MRRPIDININLIFLLDHQGIVVNIFFSLPHPDQTPHYVGLKTFGALRLWLYKGPKSRHTVRKQHTGDYIFHIDGDSPQNGRPKLRIYTILR